MRYKFRNVVILTILLFSNKVLFAQDGTVQSKQLSISRPLAPGSRVIIDQLDRKITIKASTDNTIKISTTVSYKGQPSVTDAEWWDYLNIEIKELTGLITLQRIRENEGRSVSQVSKTVQQNKSDSVVLHYTDSPLFYKTVAPTKRSGSSEPYDFDARLGVGTGVAEFDSAGKWINRKSDIKRELIIYLPAGINLKLESRLGDVVIETNLEELNAIIDHSSLTMPDAAKLTLRSGYGHIITGNIKEANINITGGKWSGKKADKLAITSRSSSVDLGSTQDATIDSGDDQYDIDEIKTIHGSKNFGDLRVLQLTGSMDITGNSTDIKIRNLTESVTSIKIEDQFADVKIPLATLNNYSIGFQGTNSKTYAPFPLPPNKNDFTTTSGDNKGPHTALQLKCSNCTLEFQ